MTEEDENKNDKQEENNDEEDDSSKSWNDGIKNALGGAGLQAGRNIKNILKNLDENLQFSKGAETLAGMLGVDETAISSFIDDLIDESPVYEKKILKELEKNEDISPEEIAENTGMDIKTVMSASGSLASKDVIKVLKNVTVTVNLTESGEDIANNVFPERTVLNTLGDQKEIPIKDLSQYTNLEKREINIALGWLVRKNWAKIDKGVIKITPKGEEYLNTLGEDELLIKKIYENKTINVEYLTDDEKSALKDLKERKNLIKENKKTIHRFKLNPLGKEILRKGFSITEQSTQLTHEQLESGDWKNLSYRPYDINAEAPEAFLGKQHPLRKIIEEIREIFLNMGFTEANGDILNSAFWNFDSLFQPQDHAAREMQDTFYMKNPKLVELPNRELVEKVAITHENGGNTESEGWDYKWDEKVAKQAVLRTHTTGISTKFLKENKPPIKMFSVGRVFRRETISYKHLPEFHQVEGIVAGEDINFQNLLGILKEFYKKLGFEKVRFRPAYFPYTYLSIETEVFFEEKGSWIELGGSGMFRPEVLEPLGIDVPVLAFGFGIERLAMLRYDLNDIRMLYKSDIEWLRDLPLDKGIKLD